MLSNADKRSDEHANSSPILQDGVWHEPLQTLVETETWLYIVIYSSLEISPRISKTQLVPNQDFWLVE